MKKDVAILMSTYNSEKYLSALLDSLVGQSYGNWRLYIRDDGSTDSTLTMIARYQQKHLNIVLLEDQILKRGAKESFIWLLREIESDYYMFCDHDDVWLPQKIEKTFARMAQIEAEHLTLPIIVHSDLVVVDENLNQLAPSFWKYSGLNPKFNSFNFYSAYNNITGCAMMINRNSREMALDIVPSAHMHDMWLAMVVSYHAGIIDFIVEPLILYRQHLTNVIGAREKATVMSRLLILKRVIAANKLLLKTVRHFKKTSILSFFINKISYKYKLLKNRY